MENGQLFATPDCGDDICLLAHTVLDAANKLYALEDEAASFGRKIHSAKTKSMSIVNSFTNRQPPPNAIVLNGHPVEEVNQFTYLGSEICKDGASDADVDCRVRKAKGAFGEMSPIWRNSAFPNSLKVRIFKSNVSFAVWFKHLESLQINHHQNTSLCEPLPPKHFSHLLTQ